jgi:predicted transposase/invertase (TIGR01784 family)
VKQYHRDGEILTTAQLRQHEIEFELYERKAKFELGRAEGEAKGRAEGKEEGKREASVEMARALLERGMNLTEIASITKLSEDQIKALLN